MSFGLLSRTWGLFVYLVLLAGYCCGTHKCTRDYTLGYTEDKIAGVNFLRNRCYKIRSRTYRDGSADRQSVEQFFNVLVRKSDASVGPVFRKYTAAVQIYLAAQLCILERDFLLPDRVNDLIVLALVNESVL